MVCEGISFFGSFFFPFVKKNKNKENKWGKVKKGGGEGVLEKVDIPINTSLPSSIIKPIADIQNHRPSMPLRPPIIKLIILPRNILTRIFLLKSVPATPNGKRKHEHNHPRDLGLCPASDIGKIQRKAKDEGAADLREPVQHIVEGAGARVESHEIHVLELVGVEPVGGEEHGKEQDDVRIGAEGFPEAEDLSFPGWVLH